MACNDCNARPGTLRCGNVMVCRPCLRVRAAANRAADAMAPKTHYRVHRDGMWRSISAFSCHFCDFTVELQTPLSFVTLFFLVPIFRLFAMRDEIIRHMRTKHPDRF